MCSVLHCFRHSTEMLLIIPDVKSKASTTFSASTHTVMYRLKFKCFIHLGMPPVVTGSPWLVARCGPLGRCLPRGARQPCGRLPGSRRVVAQNNAVIMDGRPGHSGTRNVRQTAGRLPGSRCTSHQPVPLARGSLRPSSRSLACEQQLPSAPVPSSQRAHPSDPLLCSRHELSGPRPGL